jgi:hypothetical protein
MFVSLDDVMKCKPSHKTATGASVTPESDGGAFQKLATLLD